MDAEGPSQELDVPIAVKRNIWSYTFGHGIGVRTSPKVGAGKFDHISIEENLTLNNYNNFICRFSVYSA